MAAMDMTVEVQAIPAEGATYAWACDAAALDIAEEVARLPVPAAVTVNLSRNGRDVRVRGDIVARLGLTCGRCLADFEQDVRLMLDTVYFPAGADTDGAQPVADVEANVELATYDGARIDLRPETRDVLMLSVSMSPRCRADCRGLCARCGADLNAGPCGCGPEPSASPFAGLAELKTKLTADAADERKDS